jgi:hypothetical protein
MKYEENMPWLCGWVDSQDKGGHNTGLIILIGCSQRKTSCLLSLGRRAEGRVVPA